MSNNAISYVFDQTNETNNDTFMDIKRSLNSNLLPKDYANQYSLSITKLDIPTSKIEQLYFEDRSKYTTSVKYYNHTTNEYNYFSSQMPSFNSHQIRYYTKEQVLEYLNRSLCNNFNQYLDSLTDVNAKSVTSYNGTLTNVSPISSNLVSTTTYTKLSSLKLKINSLTLNSGSQNQIIKLFVQSPDNQKNYLFIGTIGELILHQDYTINDHSYKDWSNKLTSDSDVKSYESYRKLKNVTCSGNWKIGLECNSTFSIDLHSELTLYFSDNLFIPTLPVFISQNNDFLRLNVQGYYLYNNYNVGFSNTLFNSLGFTFQNKTVNNIVYLQYDSTIFNLLDLDEIYTFNQEMASLNALCNIKEIQLKSSSFSSVGENIISNTTQVLSSNVLIEFIINKDESLGNHLLYTLSEIPWRRLDVSKLVSNLINIDFQVFASYENSLTKQINLSPGETWSVRISFIKNV